MLKIKSLLVLGLIIAAMLATGLISGAYAVSPETNQIEKIEVSPNPIFTNENVDLKIIVKGSKGAALENKKELVDQGFQFIYEGVPLFSDENKITLKTPSNKGAYQIKLLIRSESGETPYYLIMDVNENENAKTLYNRAKTWEISGWIGFGAIAFVSLADAVASGISNSGGNGTNALAWAIASTGWLYFSDYMKKQDLNELNKYELKRTETKYSF